MSYELSKLEYEAYLGELNFEQTVKELRQFFIDVMDRTEQTERENIYISLESFVSTLIQKDMEKNNEKISRN